MTRIEEAIAVISKMTLEERAEFARWFHGWEDDEWDQQMKRDAESGKLNEMLAEVDEDIRQNRLRDMP